jgi:hypothetical protein
LKEICTSKKNQGNDSHYGLSCAKPDMQESEVNFLIDKQMKLLNVSFDEQKMIQIQGQLFVTQRKYCDFIVWTPKQINVETVETIVVGDQFMENILPKLKHFYY